MRLTVNEGQIATKIESNGKSLKTCVGQSQSELGTLSEWMLGMLCEIEIVEWTKADALLETQQFLDIHAIQLEIKNFDV